MSWEADVLRCLGDPAFAAVAASPTLARGSVVVLFTDLDCHPGKVCFVARRGGASFVGRDVSGPHGALGAVRRELVETLRLDPDPEQFAESLVGWTVMDGGRELVLAMHCLGVADTDALCHFLIDPLRETARDLYGWLAAMRHHLLHTKALHARNIASKIE